VPAVLKFSAAYGVINDDDDCDYAAWLLFRLKERSQVE